MTSIITTSAAARVLAFIEDATADGFTTTIARAVEKLGIGETTVRTVVRELEAGGFIRRDAAEGRSARYVAVAKHEAAREVKMANTKIGQRPERTLERDASVLELLRRTGPLPLADVAAKLKLEEKFAYGALWRLRRDGKVTKERNGTRTPLWAAA